MRRLAPAILVLAWLPVVPAGTAEATARKPSQKPAEAVRAGLCAGDVLAASEALVLLDASKADAERIETEVVAALASGDAKCRPWAALALGRLHPWRARPALPLLRTALADKNELGRLEAYETVRRMGGLARALVPDLERAAATEAPSLKEFATTALDSTQRRTSLDERPFDLRLVALGRRENVPRAYLVDPEGFVFEVQDGQSFLDGRIVRVADDAVEFEGRRVGDDFAITPHRATLRLFERTAPVGVPVNPKEHTGAPISVDFDGDVASFAAFVATFAPLNIVVEAGGLAPVRVSARGTPWDAVVQHALTTAGLAYRAEGLVIRMGRPEQLDRHPPLPKRTFEGAPVTLLFREAEMEMIRAIFDDVGGVTIELPPGPHEPVTIYATEVPWDQAFETIAASRGWTTKRDGKRVLVTKAGAP